MLPKNCPRNYSDTVLYIYLLKMSVDGIHQLMSGSYCHSSATATPQLMNSIYWQNSLMSVSEQSDVCVRTVWCLCQNNLMSVSEHALTVSWSTCFAPLLVGHALEPGSTTTSSSLLNIAVWMTQPLSTLRNRYPDPFLCVVFDPAPNLIFASLVDQGNNTETLWSSGNFLMKH